MSTIIVGTWLAEKKARRQRFHGSTEAEPDDAASLNSITTCHLATNKWMSDSFLKSNEDQTEIQQVSPQKQTEPKLFNNELWTKRTPLTQLVCYLTLSSKHQVPHQHGGKNITFPS